MSRIRVLVEPCPKLIKRIRAASFFLTSLHRQISVSLTESAAFLRNGVLERWSTLGAERRQRVFHWALRRAVSMQPLERRMYLSGKLDPVNIYVHLGDDLLTSVLMLEALRELSKTHGRGFKAIEAFRQSPALHAHLTPRVVAQFSRHAAPITRLPPRRIA
jgi:hypothetical protein